LPAASAGELEQIYRFRDFPHFLQVWWMTTGALRTERDFRQVVTDYAAEAAGHGAVYLEGIFSPSEPATRGVSYEEVFAGYGDGVQEAWEKHGVVVRLTPDIVRGFPAEAASQTVAHAIAHARRGIVGVGLGGSESEYPPQLYQEVFRTVKEAGLGSVPHAGEADDAASVRSAIEVLGADRIRHGIRAADDPGLLTELAARDIVLDVCATRRPGRGCGRSGPGTSGDGRIGPGLARESLGFAGAQHRPAPGAPVTYLVAARWCHRDRGRSRRPGAGPGGRPGHGAGRARRARAAARAAGLGGGHRQDPARRDHHAGEPVVRFVFRHLSGGGRDPG